MTISGIPGRRRDKGATTRNFNYGKPKKPLADIRRSRMTGRFGSILLKNPVGR